MPRILSLFRPVNLFLIAVIQLVIQYLVIVEWTQEGAELFSNPEVTLIVLITVLAGAAGYVVNDIYDIGIDIHNKPGKNLVGETISMSNAWMTYGCLVLAGAILTWLLGPPYRLPGMLFYLTTTAILFSYSAYFKKTLVIGNVIVSVFAAMVVYVLWMGQDLVWQRDQNSSGAYDIVLMYSLFAFGSTLIREIVKDTEDAKGDAMAGARTLPNIAGVQFTRWVCAGLSLVFGASLILWLSWIAPQLSEIAHWYFISLVILPVFGIAVLCMINRTKRQWHVTSQYIKGVIFLGTAFLLLL